MAVYGWHEGLSLSGKARVKMLARSTKQLSATLVQRDARAQLVRCFG